MSTSCHDAGRRHGGGGRRGRGPPIALVLRARRGRARGHGKARRIRSRRELACPWRGGLCGGVQPGALRGSPLGRSHHVIYKTKSQQLQVQMMNQLVDSSKCRTVAPCGPGMSPQRWQRRGRQSLSACPARRAPAARAPESPRPTAGAPGDERAIGARMMSMSRASRRVSGRGAGRGAARRSRRHRHRSARWHASTARRRRRMRQGGASAAPSLRAQPLASRLSVRRCTRTCAGSRRSLRQRRQF